MGREIDRRSPWDIPPVNTSTVNNGGIDRGINRQIKIDHGINRKIESHEQSWEFLGMAVQAVHIPGGVDRWDNDMGMTGRSNFL